MPLGYAYIQIQTAYIYQYFSILIYKGKESEKKYIMIKDVSSMPNRYYILSNVSFMYNTLPYST